MTETNPTESENKAGDETRTIKVRRTYLIRRIQEWSVEIPAAYDIEEWKTNDFYGLDGYVTDNGDLESEDYDHVDYDELDLDVQELGEPADERTCTYCARTDSIRMVTFGGDLVRDLRTAPIPVCPDHTDLTV